MDKISLLPDDILLHILSLFPTEVVITMSVLSKRWKNLWKLVPKLEYIESYRIDHWSFLRFVDRSLLLNTAPVLESLHLKLDQQCSDEDVGYWIRIAVERGLRELSFDYNHRIVEPSRLPRSLYTCGTLVVLKLTNVSLVGIQFRVCFQLLKTLQLDEVIFLNDDTPQKLLSCCPVLEVLKLYRAENDNVTSFSLTVPSLQRFKYFGRSDSELVMKTPSLKYFDTLDYGYKCMIEYLPEIVEAHVEVTCSNGDDILRSLASVKRLLLCIRSKPLFPSGSIFHQLKHLEFCTGRIEWDLLMSMLQHSPKLRSLKLNEIHLNVWESFPLHWEEPSAVPETLMFVLETFEWRKYRGWSIQRELATFILKHSRRLKIATFSPIMISPSCTTLKEKYRMITELARLPRGSAECELVFD